MTETPFMKITLEDVYRELKEMRKEVSGVPRQVQDHEARIRSLERLVWIASGGAAIIGALGTKALQFLTGG